MENYTLWSKAMKLTLLTKNKLGFVDGSVMREDYTVDSEKKQWDRCNAIVHSWLISNVSKELMSGVLFCSNATLVWSDLKERFDKVDMSRIFHLNKSIVTHTQVKEHYTLGGQIDPAASFTSRSGGNSFGSQGPRGQGKQLANIVTTDCSSQFYNSGGSTYGSGLAPPISQMQQFSSGSSHQMPQQYDINSGYSQFTPLTSSFNWIVESGATDHMVGTKSLLNHGSTVNNSGQDLFTGRVKEIDEKDGDRQWTT
ncbi:hypothetical protein KY289_016958 [Solanum tuberosum]|nr:hypothetical protein KY289_016958 [Solanum tuberosum]